MDIHLIPWVIIQYYFSFCLSCYSFGHQKLCQLGPVSLDCVCVCVCVLTLSYFLAVNNDLDSSCVFPVLVLESAISSRGPGSFIGG